MASSGSLEQLRAAVIDGRTENVRYRQNELQRLHSSLRENATTIIAAISKDAEAISPNIRFESEAEYLLAMDGVERQFESLDFEASLKQEYLITTGAPNKDRRVGKGLVLIRPSTHTRFYSIIIPLATAITAGNCVALELASTMLNVDSVLKDLLPKALDPDTFGVLHSNIQNFPNMFLVDQTSSSAASPMDCLPSNPSARAIAVVDRAADVEAAAKTIVRARFSFQGTSPYSPDLIIVNDYIKNEFTEACSRYAGKFFSSASKATRPQNNSSILTKKVLKEAEDKGQISISGSGNFKIVEIHDRKSPIINIKVSGFYLLIIEASSLMDSFNVNKSDANLLALYTFSDLSTAKFLSQHYNARVSYADSIPSHLLVGPAAPSTPVSAPSQHKYSAEMFSSPRPQYVTSHSASDDLTLIDRLLGGFHDSVAQKAALAKLEGKIVRKTLRPRKLQPEGDHQLGFFEQGLVLGASLFLTLVVSAVGCGIWIWRRPT